MNNTYVSAQRRKTALAFLTFLDISHARTGGGPNKLL
jgi:hypothetical protein